MCRLGDIHLVYMQESPRASSETADNLTDASTSTWVNIMGNLIVHVCNEGNLIVHVCNETQGTASRGRGKRGDSGERKRPVSMSAEVKVL